MEAHCKVVWLVGVQVPCRNCFALGRSKSLKLMIVAGFQQKGDCKQEAAGLLVGGVEKASLAVAWADHTKLF